ncbi:hypothetical protein ACVWYQ_006575 [Bradyrhizobium sp. USDA 3397]
MNNTQESVAQDKASTKPTHPDWAELEAILRDEAEHIAGLHEGELQQPSRREERVGLALSGGGIRSATFSLGVIQALAQRKQIARIDYLSTVSGGGYIGAWLSACIYRAGKAGSPNPVHDVEETIAPRNIRRAAEEPSEIRFLRSYSNYLTPRLGLFSGDTLAAASGLLRNLTLNLLLGMLCIISILAFLHAAVPILAAGLELEKIGGGILLALFLSFCAVSLSLTLQRYDLRILDPTKRTTMLRALRSARIVGLFFLSNALISGSVWVGLNAKSFGGVEIIMVLAAATLGMGAGALAAVGTMRHWSLADEKAVLLNSIFSSAGVAIKEWKSELLRYAFAIIVCSAATAACAYYAGQFFNIAQLDTKSLIHVVALGPTLGVVFFWLILILWTGIVGNTYSEFTREWLNRFLGEMSGLAAFWMVAVILIVYARPLWLWGLTNAGDLIASYLSPSLFPAMFILGFAIAGWLFWRGRRMRPQEPETKRTGLMALCLILVCTLVFAITVFFQGSLLFSSVGLPDKAWSGFLQSQISQLETAFSIRSGPIRWFDPATWPFLSPAVVLLFYVAVVSLGAFACVDVNTFSLQNLYRNRLVRCYLGAAHGSNRLENPYAGFDPRDDFPLCELKDQRPYLLVNAALNITHGPNLAWQQRKAAAFVFSPRWCGYWLESGERSSADLTDASRGGYVRTTSFVHEYPAFESKSEGILIGTAIATSGAAVSSQMGFASRGPLSFLLTLLNLRLGRWFPNPAPPGFGLMWSVRKWMELSSAQSAWNAREENWKKTSPRIGAAWYLNELLGTTSERSSWIYVSDGGHFENLGIYELVRRRCTWIICVDAGADPQRTFDDLGNAVQKCRVDFGVDIEIDIRDLHIGSDGMSDKGYAFGKIRYPATRNSDPLTGELLYLKPSLPRSWTELPADIRAYRARHPEFPHEATINQWFSESQFESYRQLGFMSGIKALSELDSQSGARLQSVPQAQEADEYPR